jgi:hypothetical protein
MEENRAPIIHSVRDAAMTECLSRSECTHGSSTSWRGVLRISGGVLQATPGPPPRSQPVRCRASNTARIRTPCHGEVCTVHRMPHPDEVMTFRRSCSRRAALAASAGFAAMSGTVLSRHGQAGAQDATPLGTPVPDPVARTVPRVFAHDDFEYEFLVTLGQVYERAADAGECYAAATTRSFSTVRVRAPPSTGKVSTSGPTGSR